MLVIVAVEVDVLAIENCGHDMSREPSGCGRYLDRLCAFRDIACTIIVLEGTQNISAEVFPQVSGSWVRCKVRLLLIFGQRSEVAIPCGGEVHNDIHVTIPTDVGAVSIGALQVYFSVYAAWPALKRV